MWQETLLFLENEKTCNFLSFLMDCGRMDSVEHLLQMGANTNQHCDCHQTPLTHACASGNRDIVGKLIQYGACVNGSVQSRHTPLMAAVQGKHTSIVKCLLENRADPNVQTVDGETALHKAVYCKRNAGVTLVHLLLAYKAKLFSDIYGNTPLSLAVQRGRVDILDLLLNVQPISREARINAMELCAALRAPRDMDTVFECLQRAMEERYHDPLNIFHKPDQVPDPDLGYVLESRSLEELSERNLNQAALMIECLAIRERHAHIPGSCMKYKRVLDAYFWLFHECHYKEACFILSNEADVANMVFFSMLELPLEEFEKMLSHGTIPDFTVLIMYINAIRTHLKNRVQRKKDLDFISTHIVVHYVLEYIILCNRLVENENGEDVQLLIQTVKDISDFLQCDYHPVNTHSPLIAAVLHWKFCTNDSVKSLYNHVIVLLIKIGTLLDCRGLNGDTPLHILANSKDAAACSMARLLLENGAHHDLLDAKGRTPAQCAATEEMKTLLRSIPRPLQCLAAHVILERNLSLDPLPNPLKKFVKEHSGRRV